MTNLYELFFWGIDANHLTIREGIPSAILIPNQGKWIERLIVSEVKLKRFCTGSMLRSPKSVVIPSVPVSRPAAALKRLPPGDESYPKPVVKPLIPVSTFAAGDDLTQRVIELWVQLTAIKVTK